MTPKTCAEKWKKARSPAAKRKITAKAKATLSARDFALFKKVRSAKPKVRNIGKTAVPRRRIAKLRPSVRRNPVSRKKKTFGRATKGLLIAANVKEGHALRRWFWNGRAFVQDIAGAKRFPNENAAIRAMLKMTGRLPAKIASVMVSKT